MKRILATTALFATCAVASAADFTFDFTNLTPSSGGGSCFSADDICGTSLTFESGWLQAVATASSTVSQQSVTPDVVQDYASSGPVYVGLGVYSYNPQSSSDDNITLGETLTLTFNQVVTLKWLDLRAEGHQYDFKDGIHFSLNGDQQELLKNNYSTDSYTGKTFTFAYGGDKPDQFYLSKMTVSAVPEPESYAMMLAGLGLMGAIARRRKAKAA